MRKGLGCVMGGNGRGTVCAEVNYIQIYSTVSEMPHPDNGSPPSAHMQHSAATSKHLPEHPRVPLRPPRHPARLAPSPCTAPPACLPPLLLQTIVQPTFIALLCSAGNRHAKRRLRGLRGATPSPPLAPPRVGLPPQHHLALPHCLLAAQHLPQHTCAVGERSSMSPAGGTHGGQRPAGQDAVGE